MKRLGKVFSTLVLIPLLLPVVVLMYLLVNLFDAFFGEL